MQTLRRPAIWIVGGLLVLASFGVNWSVTHYALYIVHTDSMDPTIPSRSAVVVERGPVRIGEVITFLSHNGVVTHRFVAINPDGTYRTQGDANATADFSPALPGDVIGHVVLAPRAVGAWLYYLKAPTGLGSLVCLLLAAFVLVGGPQRLSPRHSQQAAAPPLTIPTRRHARPGRGAHRALA